MSTDDFIRFHLNGSRTGNGSIEFDALLVFGDQFRRALRAIAREGQGDDPTLAGHPTSSDQQASALRLVGISEGSAVLELEPITRELFAPVDEAIERLGRSVDSGNLSATVHGALTAAVRSLGDDGSVLITLPRERHYRFDGRILAEITPRAAAQQDPPPHVDGWLHAVDLAPDEIRVRDAAGIDWTCRFPDELEGTVLGLIDRQVRVSGEVTVGARNRIDVTSVIPLAVGSVEGVASGHTVESLIEQAMVSSGITRAQSPADLRMDLDVEDPEVAAFFEAIESLG